MIRRRLHSHLPRAGRRAMTLIELIVVMGLLATVLALSAPALSEFVGGRTLEEEARRVLALTRYGRSEAVSRAVPMELWMNVETGLYGLRPQAGYDYEAAKEPVEFELAERLRVQIEAEYLDTDGTAAAWFQPDGSIDADSLPTLVIRDDRRAESIRIARLESGLGYAIEDAMKDR